MGQTMIYPENILKVFDDPKYYGALKGEKDIYTGEINGALANSFVKIYLNINDDGEIIKASYHANGCQYLIVCCEFVIGSMKNTTANSLENIDYMSISQSLKLPDHKLHCAIMVEEAVLLALTKYKQTCNI